MKKLATGDRVRVVPWQSITGDSSGYLWRNAQTHHYAIPYGTKGTIIGWATQGKAKPERFIVEARVALDGDRTLYVDERQLQPIGIVDALAELNEP